MAVTTESASSRARAAARTLATLGRGAKDAALEQIALALERESDAIVEANGEDLAAARAAGQTSALLDRLTLDAARVLDALRGRARDRRARRPGGRRRVRLAPAERPRHPEGARAAGRAARRLRGAAQRDRRRRRPLPQERERLSPARIDECPPYECRPPALRAPRAGGGRTARGRGRPARGDARGARGHRRRLLGLRRRHPARRRGPQEVPARACARARARGRRRQLPRVPARRRRSRQGALHRRQREDAASRRVQRRRDADRAPRRAPAARPDRCRAGGRAASSCAPTRRRRRRSARRAPPPTRRTGRPSTSTSSWPCARSARSRRRSSTSSAGRRGTPRRS